MTSAVRPTNRIVVVVAALLLTGGGSVLAMRYGWRQGALFAIGGALGVSLYHAAFGFTSAWRAFLTEGRGAGLRAQMVMLAIASVVFLPVLAQESLFGQPVGGAIAPVSVSVAVGAFLFGIGMQLGGGCASGTLFAVGGGSTRTAVTLAAFIAGALIGSAHAPWWFARPSFGSVTLPASLGVAPAMLLQTGIFAAVIVGTLVWEQRRGIGGPASDDGQKALTTRLLRGPWPLLWGAVALALLNVATLAVAGHPWSITFAFSLWGAKIAQLLGVDVGAWEFWTWPYPARALRQSIFADTTSVMNIGIILGALLASGLAGRFRPVATIPGRALAAAIIGGLLLGYGARLAYGCNIGAFFSGVASGSLHGWLWLVAALAGNWAGIRLRPAFEARPV